MLGATGTIGRATTTALLAKGHDVFCMVRPQASGGAALPVGATWREGDVCDPASLRQDGFRGERFDAVISCLASRTGTPQSAWAIDHQAHMTVLAAAQEAGIGQMVLLSAICVQKPTLAFQQAKLAFERALIASGMVYSIVRPTAFFKSLSGQVDRVKRGKPYLIFGDGRLTACMPISNADLGRYLVRCLDDVSLQNKVLPIGGPGPALTPRDMGEELFRLLGRPARFRSVPLWVLDRIIGGLTALGHVSGGLRDKAELARIGRYYATESMLVLDPKSGAYVPGATPSTGQDRLFDHYAQLLRGEVTSDLGDHAVF